MAGRDVTTTPVKKSSEHMIFCNMSQLVTKDDGPVYLVTSTQSWKAMNMEICRRHLLPLFILWLSPALVEEIADDISEISR